MSFNRQIGFCTSYEFCDKVVALFLRLENIKVQQTVLSCLSHLFAKKIDQGNRKSEDLSEFAAKRKILGGDVKQKRTVEMPVRKIKMTGQRS